MEERKKYEFLVFLTIYVVFMGLMLPVAIKGPQAFMNVLPAHYQGGVNTRKAEAEGYQPAPSPFTTPIALVVASGVVILVAAGGLLAYGKLTRRDYRVTRHGRAECGGRLADRPTCRYYRPTPATECVHFLGAGDEGMCVRQSDETRAKKGESTRVKAAR